MDTLQENFHKVCRLCAELPKQCIDMFSEAGEKHELPVKIRLCLPVRVEEDDELTKMVCFSCLYKLDLCHALYHKSYNTQSILQSQLKSIKETTVMETMTKLRSEKMVPVKSEPLDNAENNEQVNLKYPLAISSKTSSSSSSSYFHGKDVKETVENNSSACRTAVIKLIPNPAKGTHKRSATVELSTGEINSPKEEFINNSENSDKRSKLQNRIIEKHCKICDQWIRDDVFGDHERLHLGGNLYSCIDCERNFQTEAQLERHACEQDLQK